MSEQELSRRSFVKAAAFAGLAAATAIPAANELVTGDYAYADETEGVQKIKTTCKACITNCACEAWVKNGRILKFVGRKATRRNDGRLCCKGLSQVQTVYHPNRLKYPVKRAGERGENKWERISWDEALTTIAEKIIDAKKQYGGGALLASSGGGGSISLHPMKSIIFEVGFWNIFEPGASQCLAPRSSATSLVMGFRSYLSLADGKGDDLYWWEDKKCKCLVIWGTNPACHQVAGSGRLMHELRANGCKMVVIDPRFTPDATRADIWLPIRPGTDVALMLSWIRYIMDKQLYDKAFCKRWTNMPYLINPKTQYCLTADLVFEDGKPEDFVVWDTLTNSPKPMPYYPFPEDIEPALMGQYTFACADGTEMTTKTGGQAIWEAAEEWTLEKAAEVCWLDRDTIEAAIKMYVENQVSAISHGVATDQQPQAEKSAQAALMIEAMMGHVCIPGAFLQQFGKKGKHDDPRPGAQEMTADACINQLGTAKKYRALFAPSANAHIPSVYDAIMTGEPYRPTVWFDASLNKLAALAEPDKWLEAAKKVDFIFCTTMYMTSFHYACADMVLPDQEWSEFAETSSQFNVTTSCRPVAHMYESVHFPIIMSQIAKACAKLDPSINLAKAPGMTQEEYANKQAPKGMTWQELCDYEDEHGFYKTAPDEEYRVYRTYEMFIDGASEPQGFKTPTRKIELYGSSYLRCRDTGAPFTVVDLGPILGPAESDWRPLPYYVEPAESPLNDKEYPLVMTSGRLPYYHHGTLRNIPYLREVYPVPELMIHPDTAAKYGIADGDWVKATSRRATTTFKAWVMPGINPGVVATERFWNPEKMEDPKNPTPGFQEMNLNMLTKKEGPYCPEVGSYTLRGFTVKIEKVDSAPEGVWYKPKDFEPWMPAYSEKSEVVF